jgi:hypothetical protein
MTDKNLHTDLEPAMEAVRASIREREGAEVVEARARNERVQRDAELLLERDEAPPRAGPRRGKDRRAYDAKSHDWKVQVQSKVIDEESDEYRSHLHVAHDALVAGDRDGFIDAMESAIYARVRDAVAELKHDIIVDLLSSGAEDEEEE